MQIIDTISFYDYEYESTDGSGVVLHAIRCHSENFLEVQRVLETFGYEAREDNCDGILFWESSGVVVPMYASFGNYILFCPEPSAVCKIITEYSPSLFQVRYKKVQV
jgi:hypothetical protein